MSITSPGIRGMQLIRVSKNSTEKITDWILSILFFVTVLIWLVFVVNLIPAQQRHAFNKHALTN